MRQNLTVLAAFLGSLSLSRAAPEGNASIALMQEDAVQHLAEIDAQDDKEEEEDMEDAEKAPTIKAYSDPEPEKADIDGPSTGPSTNGALNDDDARCYSARYQDIDALLDPKTHYASTGLQQGRLGTCAKRLTDYEAQRYLDQNPEISRMFGRNGAASVMQAKEHWKGVGYKNPVYADSVVDKDNKPFKCASKANESCKCPGTMWFGVAVRPDTKGPVETFDEMREWKTVSQETDDWQSCNAIDFGSDPMPGIDKQCYCEVKPAYEASRCAEEGDDCACNGHVYFATKVNGKKELADFDDVLEAGFAIADSAGSGSVSCSSESFKNADPAPGTAKQCFCDERKTFTTPEAMTTVMEYWTEQTMYSSAETEIETIAEEATKATKYEADYAKTVTLVSDIEYGEADSTAASCQVCDKECATDTEMTITREIEKKKTVITKKYSKQKEVNKQKKIIAENKKVESEQNCVYAQKSHDPAQKKKYLQQCQSLQIESSKLISEVEIERTTIEESERKEEQVLVEETQEVLRQKQEKTVTSTKVTEINKSKLKEEESSRITTETEERIALIKNKIETERIETQKISQQTTNIEKQVTNVQVQIEQVENLLVQEIRHEKEESFEAGDISITGEYTDTIAVEAETELTTLIEKKKTDLTAQKTKITSKIESLTSKTTELESTIETSTKTVSETSSQIDTLTSTTSSLVTQREEYKHQLKITTGSEQSKIQEQIDKITTEIVSNRKETETLVTKREEAITEETTARTEITYISQQIHSTELLEEKVDEQISVTEVVIDSRKEEVNQQTEKVSIVKVQVEAFKKKQELNSKIEEVRQYKSSVNYKISKKTHLKEETVIQISAAREELKVSESTLFTYEEQLKTTKKESDRTVITKKIEEVKKEIETITFSITTFQKTIDTITSELTELTSGTTIKTKEEEIKNLQKEVTTITNQACTSLNKLPLVKAEVSTTTTDDGTTTTVTSGTTTTTSSTCSPGVISGVSISGNLGASSTTTSDISTQIIEKQETASKLREESTRIKEVATTRKEELNETIYMSRKSVDKVMIEINTLKQKITDLRSQEKEINTKMTTESNDIEYLKSQLDSLYSQISCAKDKLKTETSKKTEETTKITDSTTQITEITSKIETAELEAINAEEEAITYITEGIEATYVVQKKRDYEKTETEYKNKQVEYHSKQTRHQEEVSTWTRKISDYKYKLVTYTTEKKTLEVRLESVTKRLTTVSTEEKKTVEREIESIKNEIATYDAFISETTSSITKYTTTLQTINTTWKTYQTTYTKLKATSYNTQQQYKETERTRVNRIRRLSHNHTHKEKSVRLKENAIRYKHATEETKKTVTSQTKDFTRQRKIIRNKIVNTERTIRTYTSKIATLNTRVSELKKLIINTKSEEWKTQYEDEITALTSEITTIKTTIKAENSKLERFESEDTTVNTKIINLEDTVKKLEEETIKIEQEAKNTQVTITSETTSKVNKEIKIRKEKKITKRKESLKKRIEKLTKIVEEKEKKIETNTKKIVDQTKKISQTSSTLTKVTHVHEASVSKHQYASCSRMIMEEPSYFDLNTICSVTYTSTSTSVVTASGKSSQLTPQSLTCQMCYSQKPACAAGASGAGISAVSFSVDTQGEATAITDQLKSSRKIADVNYISDQVNRKYIAKGAVTADPSQVRVQVITTDAKAQQVVDAISAWRLGADKSVKGLDNDAIISPLTTASSEYISSVIKATAFTTMQLRQQAYTPKIMVAEAEGLQSLSQPSADSMDSLISGFY